ncbi:hypothetical protein B0H19DRAFT_1148631 [Mycena capillaripes]|nr:hypothetical protein B0H19DRAFT_1148631 [Mycena capillaripes]
MYSFPFSDSLLSLCAGLHYSLSHRLLPIPVLLPYTPAILLSFSPAPAITDRPLHPPICVFRVRLRARRYRCGSLACPGCPPFHSTPLLPCAGFRFFTSVPTFSRPPYLHLFFSDWCLFQESCTDFMMRTENTPANAPSRATALSSSPGSMVLGSMHRQSTPPQKTNPSTSA